MDVADDTVLRPYVLLQAQANRARGDRETGVGGQIQEQSVWGEDFISAQDGARANPIPQPAAPGGARAGIARRSIAVER